MHPELIYVAADKWHIKPLQVIYDAFCFCEVRTSPRRLCNVYNAFVNRGEIPVFVEDYALKILAEHERQQKQLRLPNGYEEWRKR